MLLLHRALASVGGAAAGGFTPASLFSGGQKGCWYDINDLGTLWQDTAGTTPASSLNDPVGRVDDKSGNGYHLLQGTSGNRPLLKQDAQGFYYLQSDGSNDIMSVSAVDLSGSSAAFMCIAFYRDNTDSDRIIVENSANANSNAGFYFLSSPSFGGNSMSLQVRGNATNNLGYSTYAAGNKNLLSAELFATAADANASQNVRVNASANSGASAVNANSTSNFGNTSLNFFARSGGSLYFTGRLYGFILRSGTVTGTQITDTETWMNDNNIEAY